MSPAIALAVGMTRSWVALYTKGLSRGLRDARRLEIDSDLWEQRELAAYAGQPPLGTAAEITARAVLGILSDITWRVQAGLSARSDRSITMNESLTMRALLVLGLAAAAFPVVIGVLVVAGLNGELSSTERAIFGPVQMVAGSAIIAGLLVSARSPGPGVALVALGSIGMSLLWFWMPFITIPIGAALVYLAYRRSRRSGWPRGAGTA